MARDGICGKATPDGICHNPPGCSIAHRALSVPETAEVALQIADEATRTRRAFEDYPVQMRDKAVNRIATMERLVPPPGGAGPVVLVEDLVARMSLPEHQYGFTLSATPDAQGHLASPVRGHCVALPGSDRRLTATPAYDPQTGEPNMQAVAQLQEWLEHMEPLLGGGNVWIGGYPWTSGEHAGAFEVNATVVFPPELGDEAHSVAKTWGQHSVWTCDPDHPDKGYETIVGGSGGKSIFNRPPGETPAASHPPGTAASHGFASRFRRRKKVPTAPSG